MKTVLRTNKEGSCSSTYFNLAYKNKQITSSVMISAILKWQRVSPHKPGWQDVWSSYFRLSYSLKQYLFIMNVIKAVPRVFCSCHTYIFW